MEGETEMSEELIKLASGQFDIGSVQRLVLCALNITRIAALQGCSSLTSLDLSNNALFACTGLDAVGQRPLFPPSPQSLRSCGGHGDVAEGPLSAPGNCEH
eukprot:GGOE01054648.1.p2 GENE.GGOE01054648.1~~GGOE01054648.1.p2  ORF type:complete len:101 (-),score=34.49 GGOE01054648.1:671-973(-)